MEHNKDSKPDYLIFTMYIIFILSYIIIIFYLKGNWSRYEIYQYPCRHSLSLGTKQ